MYTLSRLMSVPAHVVSIAACMTGITFRGGNDVVGVHVERSFCGEKNLTHVKDSYRRQPGLTSDRSFLLCIIASPI